MKRLFALALFAPAFAFAQDENTVSYDYFEFNYLGSTFDLPGPDNDDASGYGGKFSIDFRGQFFMFGDYHAWEMDDLPDEPGSVSKTIGLGKAGKFGERWSVYGGLGFRTLDLDVGTGNLQEEGAVAVGGARIRFADTFEVRFGGEYADVITSSMSSILGEASVTAGIDLHLTEVVALSVEFKENEESVSTWTIGMRFYPSKDTSSLRQRR
jgi:hypothetical protein